MSEKTPGQIACEVFFDEWDEPDFWKIYIIPKQQQRWEGAAQAIAARVRAETIKECAAIACRVAETLSHRSDMSGHWYREGAAQVAVELAKLSEIAE